MIRKVEEKDLIFLAQLILNYRKQVFKENMEEVENILNTFNLAISENDNTYVFVTEDDKAHAYINFNILNFPLIGGKELYISELFVSENSKGKGYGTALLNFAIETGKSLKCKRIMLNNGKETESFLRNFYKNHNFIERENMANFILNL